MQCTRQTTKNPSELVTTFLVMPSDPGWKKFTFGNNKGCKKIYHHFPKLFLSSKDNVENQVMHL